MSKTFATVITEVETDSFNVDYLESEKPERQQTAKLVTNLLLLRDPAHYLRYHKFQQTQVNVFSLTLLLLYSSSTVYISFMTYSEYTSPYSVASIFVSLVLVCVVAVLACLLRWWNRQPSERACQTIAYLDSMWLFGLSLHASFELIITVMNGACRDGKHYGCVDHGDGLDGDRVIIAMVSPVLFFLIIRSAKWEAVLASYFLSIFSVMACVIIANSCLASFLFLLPFSTLALYEYQRQIMNLFEMQVKQEIIQEENDRLAEEAHSTELRHMIGNVAHDLKTPLSAFVCGVELIKSLAEEIRLTVGQPLLNRELVSDNVCAILENAVNVINTNSFMLMTINRCIDYTKASKNMKLTPRLETFNLQEAINLPMHCMKDLKSDKVQITFMPLAKSIAPFIITDKQWLQENILCLLSNAVKYSSRGTVILSVGLTFHEHRAGDTVRERSISMDGANSPRQVLRVEVEDTGIGLTDEVMAKLFRPFKQAQRLAGGTGLGLFSLAKRMEALGGWYGVQKRRDGQQGTIFWFEIPYRPDEEASQNNLFTVQNFDGCTTPLATSSNEDSVHHPRKVSIVSTVEVKPVSKTFTPKSVKEDALNILIVDDSPSILKMSSKMLEKQGYNITTAEDGAQALDLVLESKKPGGRRFDCVLMDLQMPVMDGLESTTRIRKFEEMNNGSGKLMIIGVSANSDTETMNDAFKAGVDAFIPKPFNFKLFNEEYNNIRERRLLTASV